MKHKQPDAQLFDRIDTSSLNEHLSKLMPGLTAKVFRTFNASYTFEQELRSTPREAPVSEKILAYNRANRQVAILCNHQRSVPKSHDDSMKRLQEKILMVKYDRYLLRQDLLSQLNKGEAKKKYPHLLEDESDLDEPTRDRKRQEKIDLAKAREAKRLEKKKQEAAENKNGEADADADEDDDDEPNAGTQDDDESKYDPTVGRRVQPVDKLLVRIEKIDTQIRSLKTNAIDRVC